MTRRALLFVLLLAGPALSGCAPYLAPAAPGIGRYPLMPPGLATSVDLSASVRGRWDNVMRLPSGAVIDVLVMDGPSRHGRTGGADGHTLWLTEDGHEVAIPRGEVVRVDLVDLPGSEATAVAKRAARGAALGMGAAALIGAVLGGGAWPPPAVSLRAGAAAGGVAGAQAELLARQGGPIYLAEDQGGPRRALPTGIERAARARPVRTYSADQWSSVSALAPGATLAVTAKGGQRHEGTLIGVDAEGIRLDVGGADLHIPRASVVRVDVLQLPGPAPEGTS